MKFTPSSLVAATAVLLALPCWRVTPAEAADDVTLNLIGINDFHGRIDANTVKFAGTVEQVRQDGGDANSLLISAGDNVSASLFASAVQGDIPTIDVLNDLQLDASAVGNHEFDKGYDDLISRLAPAADFPFLGANVFKKSDNSPAARRPTRSSRSTASTSPLIGAVTEETRLAGQPRRHRRTSTFTDPTDAINDTVGRAQGAAGRRRTSSSPRSTRARPTAPRHTRRTSSTAPCSRRSPSRPIRPSTRSSWATPTRPTRTTPRSPASRARPAR